MDQPKITLLAKDEVFRHAFYRGYIARFSYTRFDGTTAGPVDRFVLDRGDSVGMLLHDVPRNEVILVEQLRVATLDHSSGLLLELPAGRIEPGDEPAETAVREIREETGAQPPELERVATFYLTPGGSSERLHLFYAPFQAGLKVEEHGGLAEENEDIRVHRVPVPNAMEMIKDGRIADAKTILALLWLGTRGVRCEL
jgi:ADP-ribose pyrophosphatase